LNTKLDLFGDPQGKRRPRSFFGVREYAFLREAFSLFTDSSALQQAAPLYQKRSGHLRICRQVNQKLTFTEPLMVAPQLPQS